MALSLDPARQRLPVGATVALQHCTFEGINCASASWASLKADASASHSARSHLAPHWVFCAVLSTCAGRRRCPARSRDGSFCRESFSTLQ
eukprot:8064561-Pyramimonas_sp.AAC.1